MNTTTKTLKQVHTTTDYFLFKTLDGNRSLNKIHLKRLIDSIRKQYVFTVIVVNENYEIIDGQHRFEAVRELQLPLNYIICEGYGLKEVHLLNANSKTWTHEDYMIGYADLGMKDYIIYREFRNKYKFGHYECSTLLMGKDMAKRFEKFINGEFKVMAYDQACKRADMIYGIQPYYKGFNRRSFVFAMISMFNNKNFSYNEFISKLKLQPTALIDLPSVEAYKELIEEIYNYRRREKINLRFS
jgi:hypothetical protein